MHADLEVLTGFGNLGSQKRGETVKGSWSQQSLCRIDMKVAARGHYWAKAAVLQELSCAWMAHAAILLSLGGGVPD